MKTNALQATTLKNLPQWLKCPKCGRSRTKEMFGLRVMSRDAMGVPTRIAKQSYRKECRG